MRRWIGLFGRSLAWAIAHLPMRLRYMLGDLLGLMWFDLLRIRRSVVISNLGIAFPELSLSERTALGRRSMRQFGRNLTEYALLPFLKQDQNWQRLFKYFGTENIDRALAQGRGVLLLTLHIGNGDLGLAGMSLCGLPVHVVSKTFKTQWLNDLWFGLRESLGQKFIAPRNSSYAVLKALKRNGIVVFVHDQFTGPPIGIKTTFFGKETGTGLGLAMMAERSGAVVVPAYAVRNDQGQCEIHYDTPIDYEESADRDQAQAHMTQVYTDQLEKYVRMYPDQWMWLHKRWKVYKH